MQAVNWNVHHCVFVNCGNSAGEAAIFLDPGVTASVQISLAGCYIISGDIGVKGATCRALSLGGTVFESCTTATQFTPSDGAISNCWFEGNTVDGDWTDCQGMVRHDVLSTNFNNGIWNYSWSGVLASQRAIVNSYTAYGEMYHKADIIPGAAGSWVDCRVGALCGKAHRARCR